MPNPFVIYIHTIDLRLGEAELASKFVERLVDDLHAGGIIVKGTTGFVDQLPDCSGTCVCAIDLGGVPDIGPSPQGMVQFLIRSDTDWETCRDKAAEVFNYYHTMTDYTITDYRILSAVAESMPAHYGEDERQRHRIAFNMVFRYHATYQGTSTRGYGGGKKDPNQDGA